MTTPARRTGSESTATATPFSYAQAAKGISSSPSSAPATSKPASGTATPSKDANATPANLPAPQEMSWADDAEAHSGPQEVQPNGTSASSKQTISQPLAAIPTISSPELGASTASTGTKDDDVLSVQNQSSESTWENKSQTSNSVDKALDQGDVPSAKAIKKEVEKFVGKPLQEAPLPPVNIWQQRASELKAKSAQKVNAPKPVATVSNGVPQGLNGASRKKTRAFGISDDHDSKTKPSGNDSNNRSRDEEKANRSRKEDRLDYEVDRSKKNGKPRSGERDGKFNASLIPLLPDRDQESWPTPDSAIDEDRRKANERDEKADKEKNQSSKPLRKPEWKPVPITPSVVFNTPLPNTSSGRRGGRGGGRGGAQSGGRAGPYGANNLEKDISSAAGVPNGDQSRRGRAEAPQARDTSPANTKRAVSAGSATLKDSKPLTNGGDKASKGTVGPEVESSSRKSSEPTAGQQGAGQNNTFPRQYPGRPNKNKRGEFSAPSEKRKDGDVVSPKEHAGTFDRRTSSTTLPDDGERRAPAFQDGQSSQPKQGSNDRRQFASYSNRERGRGASRGGARSGHGFQNGHNQFANAPHPTTHPSSTFPLPRSPTTLHAEHPPYFPSVPAHNRTFRGNGPRSQSLTTDNMYGRGPNGYATGPPPIAPIQPYVGNVYDYSMVPPMSAVGYSPYVDPFTLQSMVSTQLEYYFSVENLCKDIFLRRHMDSKGFVFLSVIADFNRIKQLTVDMELIKLVCYQSRVIEWLVGSDGKDRVRRQEGWEQWVLNLNERDSSVQNDGPEELQHPPVPHAFFPEGQFGHRFQEGPAGSPTGPISPTSDPSYQSLNGVHASPQATPNGSAHPVHHGVAKEDVPNGTTQHNHSNRLSSHAAAVPEFKPANAEADSFSNEQVETLNVLVRKHDQAQQPHGMPNGSIDVNGTGPSQGIDGGKIQDPSMRLLTPFPSGSYWVKGQDSPVKSPPGGSSYEFYAHLRSKALEQRQNAPTGNCPYDMNVLYQFWSHFLVRNFNTHMYDEFRHFALEDASRRMSNVGLNNLIIYYGASLSSSYMIRERVARHYVELVNLEMPETDKPAFKQLRSAWRNGALNLKNRKRISEFINDELRAALER